LVAHLPIRRQAVVTRLDIFLLKNGCLFDGGIAGMQSKGVAHCGNCFFKIICRQAVGVSGVFDEEGNFASAGFDVHFNVGIGVIYEPEAVVVGWKFCLKLFDLDSRQRGTESGDHSFNGFHDAIPPKVMGDPQNHDRQIALFLGRDLAGVDQRRSMNHLRTREHAADLLYRPGYRFPGPE
jgi:hypothetical protein